MNYLSRRTFLELAGASLICGCSNSTKNIIADGDFPVLAFSDLHFDPFFDPKLFSALNAADANQWLSIFKRSTVTTPSKPGSDTNYPLFALALASIRRNLGASPFILFTGDLLGHYILQLYGQYSGTTDTAPMQAFTNKVVSFVTQQIRAAAGSVPVYFAVGNCDSYTGYGPDSTFLSSTVDLFFTELLKGEANYGDFVTTFKAGGYYSVEPAGTNVMVIGLNTIALSPLVQNKDGSENNQVVVDAQLAWFDSKLAAAQTAGKRVWLLMHAPPGADEGTTAKSAQADGQIASATMMWEANYQATFMQTIKKYPGVIAMTLAGHTHMDEYRIMSPGNVVDVTPSISPAFSNDPAYRVFTIDRTTLAPKDYNTFNYDLTTMPGQFNAYYRYSEAYQLSGSLGDSLEKLRPELVTNPALQALYRGYYYSGQNAANLISDANWPIYWGGIGSMLAQDLMKAVNSY